jgi:hypothetical protein
MRYLRLICRVTTAFAALCLAETFDYSGRSPRNQQLDLLRRSRGDGSNDFWVIVPAAWESGESHGRLILTFQERRDEYEALGYMCLEVHQGYERALFDAKLIPSCSGGNREVIAARFGRQHPAAD